MALDKTFFEDLEARIPKGKVRTRFAPSPTGYMHVGNLRTALYTWLIARHADGTFILRIEDTDQGRLVEGATDVIYRTMKECHLDHDEGPDVGGPTGPYIQSERRDLYLPYAQLLVEKGAAYYCFCEKAESEEDSGEFDRADDPCRNLSEEEVAANLAAGKPYVIRQRIPHEGTTTFHDVSFGDITVAKVAARFHYSPSYLTAMYRRVFGVGVAEQIIEYRIDRARELLSSTASSVADIAREVGYADPKYFMRVFKRRTGLTPGQYRDAFPARLYNTV